MPICSDHELLVGQTYGGILMKHFDMENNLDILLEHSYLVDMKHDMQSGYDKCITCKQEKSIVKPHGMYTPFPISNQTWTDISNDFVIGLPKFQIGKDNIFVIFDKGSKMA